ncbi:MAG: hypothetical protein K8F32_06230, partial [Rhodocyclaceae bacterium]|nr:hypothetical protein [Rhodocyclaceae bacterium]
AMAGIHLDAAHWATRRKHEALKAAREALRPLLGRQAGIDNTWQTAAESLANQIDEMQKSGAMGDEELRHLAGQVRLW